jgi:hypothetical protein
MFSTNYISTWLSASNPLTPRIDKNLGNPRGEKGVGLYACES